MMKTSRSQDEIVSSEPAPPPYTPSRSMAPFYAWRFLASWGDRLWLFGLAMLLVTLPESRSLSLVATQLALCVIANLALGSMIKKWATKQATFCEAAFFPLAIQKASICFSSAILLLQSPSASMALLAIAFSVIAHLAGSCHQLAINRKWLLPYCNGYVRRVAAERLNRIDLACGVLAPLAIGAIMKFFDAQIAALVIIIWQFASILIEAPILYHTYSANRADVFVEAAEEEDEGDDKKDNKPRATFWQSKMLFESFTDMVNSWRRFSHNNLSWVAFATAALFFAVISLDPITLGYLRLYCIDSLTVAAVYSTGCIAAALGSALYPFLRSLLGLRRGGLILYLLYELVIIACFASFSLPGLNSVTIDEADFCATKVRFQDSVIYHSSHLVFFIAAALCSQFLHLLCDEAVKTVMTEHLSDTDRFHFENVQPTLNSLVDLWRISLAFILPLPSQFGMLVLVALIVVACGWMTFWLGCPDDLVSNLAKKFTPQKKSRK